MNFPLLEKISQPSDLKKLSNGQVNQLCEEIRAFLLDHVSKTGGHLASNLGAVELTVALHRVLETPKDEIVFDVGHQCYTHKILTGRGAAMDTLRTFGGISGFPKPGESASDAFIAGPGYWHGLGQETAGGAGPCGCRHWRWLVHGRHGLRGDEQHWRAG